MENTTQFHICPARPDEAGLFYAQHPSEDEQLGTIGHVRMDFGKSGNEFWHTWHPRGAEELNSPAFKAELQQVVDKLREDVLKNRFAMERFCYEHGGKINGGWTQNYGFIVEAEHYQYCLRCNPSPGDYNAYPVRLPLYRKLHHLRQRWRRLKASGNQDAAAKIEAGQPQHRKIHLQQHPHCRARHLPRLQDKGRSAFVFGALRPMSRGEGRKYGKGRILALFLLE